MTIFPGGSWLLASLLPIGFVVLARSKARPLVGLIAVTALATVISCGGSGSTSNSGGGGGGGGGGPQTVNVSVVAQAASNPGKFAPFEVQAKTPTGSFHAKVAFCMEACILEPLQARSNTPRSALDAVRLFYTYIIRYHQLGIPSGRAKKALWPLLSKRLAQQLDSLEECDEDYYRRYGEILRANTYKPATPWLEEGLFTGPDDAATPRIFRILGSRAIGDNRIDVELGFTTKQTYSPDLHLPPSFDHYEGVVTAILENNRWVIDDYVAMYANDELQRLSAGYSECRGGQWIGENLTERAARDSRCITGKPEVNC